MSWDANGSPTEEEPKRAEKKCIHCKRTFPLVEFGRNKYSRDGIDYYCRECKNTYQARRREKFVKGA
jgi:hypothetical protein